jgi:cytosine/adenosine deaminase-related metal-dependent hydrolase
LARLARSQGYTASDLHQRLLEAATLGGARAIGFDAGALVEGRRADVAVFAVDDAERDPYDALLGSGRCVQTVVAGRTG